MSCPREETYAIWLDGELPSAERRSVEAHLVQCEACRARVLALREEAELLADVLLDREPPRLLRREPAAPARGLALGLVPATVLVTALIAATGWLLEHVPTALEWINPFQLKGATEMLFKLIFSIRDAAPGLLGVGVAFAATCAVSAILTFTVTAVFRRWLGPGALVLAALALVTTPSPSEAHLGLHSHEDFTLESGETHDGTLIVSGGTVNIDGVVTGDLLVLAERLTVRGEVQGNVFVFAETLNLSGTVDGSVHVGSDRAEISGAIDGDLYAGAENFELARGARIARDALVWVADGVLEGSVGRDLYAAGSRMEVRGRIGRDLHAYRVRLSLRDGSEVGGDVEARVRPGGSIDVAPGAHVAGETRTEELPHHGHGLMGRYREPAFYVLLLLQLAAAFVSGMLLHTLVPGLFQGRLETTGAFFRSLGLGFLGLVVTPLVLVLTAVTLIGLPVAMMGLALYLAALYVSSILVGALIGSAIMRPGDADAQGFGLALLAGLAVVLVLAHLPFVGGPVHVVVLLAGLGLLIERARAAWIARRLAG